eukprot:scaffold88971_cov23-Cyclotella_meneghiniana.AAC.1
MVCHILSPIKTPAAASHPPPPERKDHDRRRRTTHHNNMVSRQDITDAQARGQDAIRRMEEAMGIPTANIVPQGFIPPNYQNRCAVVDAIGDAFALAHGAANTRPVAQIQLPQPQLQQLGDLQPPQQEEEPHQQQAEQQQPAQQQAEQQQQPQQQPQQQAEQQPQQQLHVMDADTQDVMRASSAPTTRGNYLDARCHRLCRFLFDKALDHPDVISQELMGQMLVAHQEDQDRQTARNRPSKLRTSINDCVKAFVNVIIPGDVTTYPLHFDKLTFHTVSTKRRATDVVLENQEEGHDDGLSETSRDDSSNMKVLIRLGAGAFSSARSGLAFLYGECGVPRDHTKNTKYLWMQLPTYQKGSARTAAKQREDLGMRTLEGKDPIPFAAYVHLANILLRSRNPEHVAVHLFLLLDWNLITRANQVVKANIDLIGVQEDCLKFHIGTTKTDQGPGGNEAS